MASGAARSRFKRDCQIFLCTSSSVLSTLLTGSRAPDTLPLPHPPSTEDGAAPRHSQCPRSWGPSTATADTMCSTLVAAVSGGWEAWVRAEHPGSRGHFLQRRGLLLWAEKGSGCREWGEPTGATPQPDSAQSDGGWELFTKQAQLTVGTSSVLLACLALDREGGQRARPQELPCRVGWAADGHWPGTGHRSGGRWQVQPFGDNGRAPRRGSQQVV